MTKKKMRQWSMRIGAYAENFQGLERIDWRIFENATKLDGKSRLRFFK